MKLQFGAITKRLKSQDLQLLQFEQLILLRAVPRYRRWFNLSPRATGSAPIDGMAITQPTD
jgi:hypothetical protein